MSGFLGLGIEAALGLSSSRYRPASFRGAPFKVVEQSGEGGRSLGIHILPLRDRHVVEDLGASLNRISLTGYVVGGDYVADRDALIKACTGSDEPGTLVLPTLGERKVYCEAVRYAENLKEGGFCGFDLTFVEAAPAGLAVASLDRFGQVLRQAGVVLNAARQAYSIYRASNGDLGAFLGRAAGSFAESLAGSLASQWLGLSGLSLAGLRSTLATLTATDGDDADATAAAIAAPFQALAEAAETGIDPATRSGEGAAEEAAQSRPEVPAPGLRMNLLLSRAESPAQMEGPDTRAVADLARDAAAAMAAQAAVLAPWSSAADALAARDAVVAILVARELAAADREEPELANGFRALAAEVQQDLVTRAARLPMRAPYALPGSLPALALAQRLHAGAARGAEVLAQNIARHPAFMPRDGWRLRP